MKTSTPKNKSTWIALFIFISLLGMYIHNTDLPELTPLSPENSIPTLISVVLFILWWRMPNSKATTSILLGWAVLNLVGGILSAIPFSFWSLGKLQTTGHLLKHTVYALAQLPLIIALTVMKRNSPD